MRREQIDRQIVAILDHNGLPHTPDSELGGYAVRFSSALLRVGLTTIGEQVVITLRATVLRELPVGRDEDVLTAINELNCRSHFGKWALYRDDRVVGLEYDLLGDHLQEGELMTGLATLGRLADHHDDLLQRQFGGKRAYEVDG